MKLSKIGSTSTYHRCIKQLDGWKYLYYFPSKNPYRGSQIKMRKFQNGKEEINNPISDTNSDTSTKQVVVQQMGSYINIYKHTINNNKLELPKNENEVLEFFKKEKWPVLEGKKFFNHYQGIGWKIGGKVDILNWHSTAKNWMLKSQEFKNLKTEKPHSQNSNNLKTTKNKDYDQPL